MNALLGVEIPHTNNTNQTSIIQAYIDPPTELVRLTAATNTPAIGEAADGTQIWKITHNGVDTHSIHFHMFHVQVVNRVGWDGAIRKPDANELGWKDSVRMNPLEDVFVAMRPKTLDIPTFQVPNSWRPLDPTQPLGVTTGFTGVDPNGLPVTVTNDLTNFGWEHVWHCHILGHEENDMMRALAIVAPPVDAKQPRGDAGREWQQPAGGVGLERQLRERDGLHHPAGHERRLHDRCYDRRFRRGERDDLQQYHRQHDPAVLLPGVCLQHRRQPDPRLSAVDR